MVMVVHTDIYGDKTLTHKINKNNLSGIHLKNIDIFAVHSINNEYLVHTTHVVIYSLRNQLVCRQETGNKLL